MTALVVRWAVLIGWFTIIGVALGAIVIGVKLAHGSVKLERMDQRWLEQRWLEELKHQEGEPIYDQQDET